VELLTRSSTKWPPTLTSTVDRAVASMTVRDKIDAAKKELGAVVSTSRATQNAVDLIGGINTTVSQIDTINSTCFDPLKAFNTVVSTIANVLHRIFLGVTSRLTFIHRSTLAPRWHWGFSPMPLRCALLVG